MPVEMRIYMGCWLLATAAMVGLLIVRRGELELFSPGYRAFLTQRWRWITFVVAAVPMMVMAPWTGDPTWDWFDAGFMALLAYTTAPWVVGAAYRNLRGRRDPSLLYILACLWLFSVGWSYDGYIVLRDGNYPETWLPNLFASSVLYLSAGLFWNLAWNPRQKLHFAFTEPDWPAPCPHTRFVHILWVAVPLMLLVAGMMIPFLL